jgi:hypothetical protein
MAHRWLEQGLPTGHNISRLDLALTIWGVSDQSSLIALHSVEADEYRKALHSRPFDVRLIDGFGKGDTLYDKEKEQVKDSDYKTAIRYECECKERLASSAYQRCVSVGYSAASCLAVLLGLLRGRGIKPVGHEQSTAVVVKPAALPVSTVESSLSWLNEQVSPTVRRLLREGYELDVLDALGLGHLIPDAGAFED